jgi:periplasmic divalent cation tolerance protein
VAVKKFTPDVRVVLVTAPEKDAEKIATTLLEERLIACANLLPVRSLYWWQEKIQRETETLLISKAPVQSMPNLLRRLKELHSYEVPEFLALGVLEANPDYRAWVRKETRRRNTRTSRAGRTRAV